MEITPLTVWIEDVEEEIPTKLALCNTCRGTGRINVIDEDKCTSEQIELYRKQQEQFWADEAVARSEIEHGA